MAPWDWIPTGLCIQEDDELVRPRMLLRFREGFVVTLVSARDSSRRASRSRPRFPSPVTFLTDLSLSIAVTSIDRHRRRTSGLLDRAVLRPARIDPRIPSSRRSTSTPPTPRRSRLACTRGQPARLQIRGGCPGTTPNRSPPRTRYPSVHSTTPRARPRSHPKTRTRASAR